MAEDSGTPQGSMVQTCHACGFSFDHDVARCPDCGQRTALGRRRAVIIATAVVVAVAILAALWAANVTPISTG